MRPKPCITYSITTIEVEKPFLITVCSECYDNIWAEKIESQDIVGYGIVCQECGK